MSRRGWLIPGSLIVVGIVLWRSLQPPSDAEMMLTFKAHRAVFDQLVQMYTADDQDMWISTRGVYWVGTATSVGVPLRRRMEYIGLLWRARVSSIGVGGVRDYAGPHRAIPFDSYAYLQLPGNPVKSFMYTTEPLPLALTEGDTQGYTFPAGTLYRKVCRELEERWYICMDYED